MDPSVATEALAQFAGGSALLDDGVRVSFALQFQLLSAEGHIDVSVCS